MIINLITNEIDLSSIKNSLTTNCGSIEIKDDKVILSYNGTTKEYSIKKVNSPYTGKALVKFSLIISLLSLIIGISLFINFKIKKDKVIN